MRALLLLGDIVGYTRFMGFHRINLAHSRDITARLLEAMVDAVPSLELVEIDGDAVFLYAFMFAFAARLPWSLVGTGVTPGEMKERFAPWFDPVGLIPGRRPRGAAWYRFRRR